MVTELNIRTEGDYILLSGELSPELQASLLTNIAHRYSEFQRTKAANGYNFSNSRLFLSVDGSFFQ
ncbi:MAG: hypothetical protein AAB354_01760 [candidate division KSB1 bacterium]